MRNWRNWYDDDEELFSVRSPAGKARKEPISLKSLPSMAKIEGVTVRPQRTAKSKFQRRFYKKLGIK